MADAEVFKRTRSVKGKHLYESALDFGAVIDGKSSKEAKTWDWVVPNPRAVFEPGSVHMSKTTSQQMRKHHWFVMLNVNNLDAVQFGRVVETCAKVERKEENTEDGYDLIDWLDEPTQNAYRELYDQLRAYSIDVLDAKGKLVGGLFGLVLPNYLTIESMFTIESGSSKAALLYLEQLCLELGIEAIDAQDYYEHLASLGAKRLTAKQFEAERKRYSPIPSDFFSCGERMRTSAWVVIRKKDASATESV